MCIAPARFGSPSSASASIFLRHGAAAIDVPLPEGEQTCAPEWLEAKLWVTLPAGCKRRIEPATALAPVATNPPEMPDLSADQQCDVGASVFERIAEYGADVVVLRFDPVVPDRRAPGQQLGTCQLCKLEELGAVPLPQNIGAAGLLESLDRELADRLEHPEALLRVADEALVDE